MISPNQRDGHPLRDDVEDLQRTSLVWVSTAAAAAGFAFLVLCGGNPQLGRPVLWLVVGGLAVVLGGVWTLLDRAYTLAASILSVGLVAVIVFAATVYDARDVLFGIPLIIFIVPVLLDYRATIEIAVLAGAAVGLLKSLAAVPLSSGDVLVMMAFITASVVLGWIAYRPTRIALHWAWESSLEDRRMTQEVRARQAELAGLSKSLTEACDRLENANLALAQARQDADEARRHKEEFATAISHELRTPLNLIIGFSELIAHGPTEEDEKIPDGIRRDIDTIYRNACHLSKLVDDVLDLGRIDAHRLALQKEWSPLSEIVQGAASAVDGLFQRAGLDLAIDLPVDLPLLYVDPTRIRQVLINLLANAVRYTEEGGILVVARCDAGEVVVSVHDPGIGIPSEDLPYVFDYFRQVGHPRGHDGFGVGLTVSKRFVEMHAGSMWVTSERGHGTTFFFSLPRVDNVAAVASELSRERMERHYLSGPRERTVLVLDPDAEAARIFQRYLDGYRVLIATSPADACQIAEREAIQAVISADSGASIETDLAVRGDTARVPILRCALHTVAGASREMGALAFLTKPVSSEQLGVALGRLVRRPRHAVIVDDDPAMGNLLGRMLRGLVPDCHVDAAADGECGLALARNLAEQGNLDVVFLDLLMPGMDGHDFLRIWSSEPGICTIPVVIVSAASEQDHDVVVGDFLEIRRRGGLTVGDVMRTVRASLDSLLQV